MWARQLLSRRVWTVKIVQEAEFSIHPTHKRKDPMKNKLVLAVLLAIATLSAGCNTVSGAGKDIERGGEKIQGAADRHN